MLRDRKLQLQASLSRVWRVGLVAILIVAGLGIAGLRGPGETGSNLAQAAPPKENAAQNDPPAKFSLDYLPANATFVLAIRPAELFQHEALKPLQGLDKALFSLGSRYGMSSVQPDEALAIMYKKAGRSSYGEMAIFRSKKPIDIQKYKRGLIPDPVGKPIGERVLYFDRKLGDGDSSPAYAMPDTRTIIAGNVGVLTQILSKRPGDAPLPRWAEQWKSVAADPIAVALDVQAIRGDVERELSPTPSATPWIKLAAPMWEQTDLVVAGATLGDKLALRAKAVCISPDGAEKVQETSKALIPLALNMIDSMRADSAKARPGTAPSALATMNPLFDLAEKALKSIKFSQSGAKLNAEGEVPLDAGRTLAALLPPVEAAREAARRSQSTNNMKQIALALHNYNDKYGKFPPAIVIGPDGKTPHSWRVEILPYLEQSPAAATLYERYRLDEPWDSENNRKVLAQMPTVFRDPNDDPKSTNASYFAVTGDTAAFSGKDGNKIQAFTDGTSNTIMVVEAKRDVPWTKPDDIAYDPAKPLPALGGHIKEGFLAAFVDGSVRLISKEAEEKLLRALFTKAGGEVVNVPN